MRIKVRNRVYSGDIEPVMIIISEGEREQIANMAPGATKYCVYPDTWSVEDIKKWMADIPETEGAKQ